MNEILHLPTGQVVKTITASVPSFNHKAKDSKIICKPAEPEAVIIKESEIQATTVALTKANKRNFSTGVLITRPQTAKVTSGRKGLNGLEENKERLAKKQVFIQKVAERNKNRKQSLKSSEKLEEPETQARTQPRSKETAGSEKESNENQGKTKKISKDSEKNLEKPGKNQSKPPLGEEKVKIQEENNEKLKKLKILVRENIKKHKELQQKLLPEAESVKSKQEMMEKVVEEAKEIIKNTQLVPYQPTGKWGVDERNFTEKGRKVSEEQEKIKKTSEENKKNYREKVKKAGRARIGLEIIDLYPNLLEKKRNYSEPEEKSPKKPQNPQIQQWMKEKKLREKEKKQHFELLEQEKLRKKVQTLKELEMLAKPQKFTRPVTPIQEVKRKINKYVSELAKPEQPAKKLVDLEDQSNSSISYVVDSAQFNLSPLNKEKNSAETKKKKNLRIESFDSQKISRNSREPSNYSEDYQNEDFESETFSKEDGRNNRQKLEKASKKQGINVKSLNHQGLHLDAKKGKLLSNGRAGGQDDSEEMQDDSEGMQDDSEGMQDYSQEMQDDSEEMQDDSEEMQDDSQEIRNQVFRNKNFAKNEMNEDNSDQEQEYQSDESGSQDEDDYSENQEELSEGHYKNYRNEENSDQEDSDQEDFEGSERFNQKSHDSYSESPESYKALPNPKTKPGQNHLISKSSKAKPSEKLTSNPAEAKIPKDRNPGFPGNTKVDPGFARYLLHPKADNSKRPDHSFPSVPPPDLFKVSVPDAKEHLRTRLADMEKKIESKVEKAKKSSAKSAEPKAVIEDDLEVKMFRIPGISNLQETHELRRVFDQVQVFQAASKIQACIRGYLVRKNLFRARCGVPSDKQMKNDIHQILLKYYPEAYVPDHFGSGVISESLSYAQSGANFGFGKALKDQASGPDEVSKLETFISPVFKEKDEYNLIRVLVKEYFQIDSEASAKAPSVQSSEVYSEEFESEPEDVAAIFSRAQELAAKQLRDIEKYSIEESIQGFSSRDKGFKSIQESFEHSVQPVQSKPSSSIKESLSFQNKGQNSSEFSDSIRESIENKSQKTSLSGRSNQYSIQESLEGKEVSKVLTGSIKESFEFSEDASKSNKSTKVQKTSKTGLKKDSVDSSSFKFRKITESIPESNEEDFARRSGSSSPGESVSESIVQTGRQSEYQSSEVSESIQESITNKESSSSSRPQVKVLGLKIHSSDSSESSQPFHSSSENVKSFNKTSSSRNHEISEDLQKVTESNVSEGYDDDFESASSRSIKKPLFSSQSSGINSSRVPKIPLKLKSEDPEIRFSQHQSSEYTESIKDDIDESIHYSDDFESEVSEKRQISQRSSSKDSKAVKGIQFSIKSGEKSDRKASSSSISEEIEESIKSSIGLESSFKKPFPINDSGKHIKVLESIGESIKYTDDFESNSYTSPKDLSQKKDFGKSSNLKDSGKSSHLKDSDKSSNLKDSGKSSHLKDSGKSSHLKDSGKSSHLKDSDKSSNLKDSGKSSNLKDSFDSKPFESYSEDFESVSQSNNNLLGLKPVQKESHSEENSSEDIKESIYSESHKSSTSSQQKSIQPHKNISAIYINDASSEEKSRKSSKINSNNSENFEFSNESPEKLSNLTAEDNSEKIPKLLLPSKAIDPESRFSQHKSSDYSESMQEDIAESIYSDDFESERSERKSLSQSQRSRGSSYHKNPSNFNTKFPAESLSPSSPQKLSGRVSRKSPELRSSTSSISEDIDMYDSFSKQSVNFESSLRRSASMHDSKASKNQESVGESIQYSEDFESESRSFKPGHSYSSDFESISQSDSRALKGLRVPIKEESPEESSSQEITGSNRETEEGKREEEGKHDEIGLTDQIVDFIFEIIQDDALSLIDGREVNEIVDYLCRTIIDDSLRLVPSKKIYVNNPEYLDKTLDRIVASAPAVVKPPSSFEILQSYMGGQLKLENFDLNSGIPFSIPSDYNAGFRSVHKAIKDSTNLLIQDFDLSLFRPVKAKHSLPEVKQKISKWLSRKLGSTKSCLTQEDKKQVSKQNDINVREVVNEELEEEQSAWMDNERVEVKMAAELEEYVLTCLADELKAILSNN